MVDRLQPIPKNKDNTDFSALTAQFQVKSCAQGLVVAGIRENFIPRMLQG
jgi:hypothetical protein